QDRNGVVGSGFRDLVSLGLAAAAECDLAACARVQDPARGPVAGDQPAVPVQLDHVHRRRVKLSRSPPRHREDVTIGGSQAEPGQPLEPPVDRPRCAPTTIFLGHAWTSVPDRAGRRNHSVTAAGSCAATDGARSRRPSGRPQSGDASNNLRSPLKENLVETESRSNSDYTKAWSRSGEVEYVALADGTRLRYLKAGSGPALILLHTVRTQLDHFQLVIPKLVDAFTIFAVDFPGMGWSDIAPGASYAEPALRRAIVEFVKTLELDDVTLAGRSMGAAG